MLKLNEIYLYLYLDLHIFSVHFPFEHFCRLRNFSQSTIGRPRPAGGCPCVGGCVGVWVPSKFFWDLPRVSILGNEEMAPIGRPEGCPPAPSPKTLKMP